MARTARERLIVEKTGKARPAGRILLFTGDGKGKTTAALGTLLRASGQGLRCVFVSFIKSAVSSPAGEDHAVARLETAVIARLGEGFVRTSSAPDKHQAAARSAWDFCRKHLADPEIDLVVLDEITYPINYGWIAVAEVAAAVASRPPGQHVILAGRDAAPELVALADTVTEMREVKHAFATGIPATRGLEW